MVVRGLGPSPAPRALPGRAACAGLQQVKMAARAIGGEDPPGLNVPGRMEEKSGRHCVQEGTPAVLATLA